MAITERTSLITNDAHTNSNIARTKCCSKQNSVLWFIIAIAAVLTTPFLFHLSIYYFQNDIPFYLPTHHHSVPTLLSVRDYKGVKEEAEGGNEDSSFVFVNALQNDVYEKMKGAHFVENVANDDDDDKSLSYSLSLDKEIISFHDSITIYWDCKDNGMPSSTFKKDEDVIALYCPASEQQHDRFLEAATLHQAEITSLLASSLPRQEENKEEGYVETEYQNKWFIPSFPVVKYSSCEFRLWKRVETKNVEEDSKRKEQQQQAMYQLISTAQFQIENGSTKPTNIHLSFTNDVNEMSVSFSTGSKGIPIVIYDKSQEVVVTNRNNNNNNEKVHVRVGTSQTYTSKDLCEGPANMEEPGKFLSPGMLHSISMTELNLDSLYFYKVGVLVEDENNTLDTVIWSDVYSFKSNVAPGDVPSFSSTKNDGDTMDEIMMEKDEIPLKIVVYADQGLPGFDRENTGDVTSIWSKREIETHDIRAVHHFGDLAYAMGSSHIWDAWMDSVSIFARHVPLMVGIGNHEYDHEHGGKYGRDPSGLSSSDGYSPPWGDFRADSYGECAVPVTKRFTMPSNGNGVFWYSFDQGLVHTIMISSEHDTSPKSEQYTWLERDLQSVDRTKTPWLILELHRPMYMIEDIHENTVIGQHMLHNFEHLLQNYNVDLVLSGHYHSYFRSCPGLYRDRCDNDGPLHVTIGTAGAALDRGVPLLRKPWSKVHLLEWGYGRLSVYRQRMLLEFVSDADGVVKDSYWLYK